MKTNISRMKALFLVLWALWLMVVLPGVAGADAPEAGQGAITADSNDGPSYEVRAFVFEYQLRDHPGLPPLDELMEIEVKLTETANGYIAPRAGAATMVRLGDVPKLAIQSFYASAIRKISEEIVNYFNQEGFIGIYVTPHEEDIDPDTYEDMGREGRGNTLRMVIWTGIVREVRTIASGERIASEARINNPRHERIMDRSPVAAAKESEEETKDLLRKDLLDDYIGRLNRHPGRKVDVALSGAEEPGEVVLDFLVTETKGFLGYMQLSNTGTKNTNEWRERFGITHNQVTGNDDIMTLDYITAGFSEAHSVVGSYERPLFDTDDWRWRVYGTWGQFDASEVGFANEQFHSEEWGVGAELIKNVLQYEELFVDAFAGARWRNIMVENEAAETSGESDFFLPTVGLRLERNTGTSSTYGQVEYEWNWSGVSGTEEEDIIELGRTGTEKDWRVVKWSGSHSFFLEPALNRQAWEDTKTPESSTLAHEVALSLRGQYSFGDRLIPQAIGVVGGLYTVRGYPESIVNGDTTYVGSVEYRYHIPKAFKVQPETGDLFGKPFRWAPQQLYGRPDWDLIVRTFFDIGGTSISEPLSFETDETLMGTGVGLELQLTRNFSVRADWGFALEDVESAGEYINSGHEEIHVVGTVVF